MAAIQIGLSSIQTSYYLLNLVRIKAYLTKLKSVREVSAAVKNVPQSSTLQCLSHPFNQLHFTPTRSPLLLVLCDPH